MIYGSYSLFMVLFGGIDTADTAVEEAVVPKQFLVPGWTGSCISSRCRVSVSGKTRLEGNGFWLQEHGLHSSSTLFTALCEAETFSWILMFHFSSGAKISSCHGLRDRQLIIRAGPACSEGKKSLMHTVRVRNNSAWYMIGYEGVWISHAGEFRILIGQKGCIFKQVNDKQIFTEEKEDLVSFWRCPGGWVGDCTEWLSDVLPHFLSRRFCQRWMLWMFSAPVSIFHTVCRSPYAGVQVFLSMQSVGARTHHTDVAPHGPFFSFGSFNSVGTS